MTTTSSPLRLGIVGVTRHGDVAARRFFIERGVEFAPVNQPAFQLGGGLGLRRARLQLVKKRRDLRPVAELKVLGNERARPVSGQFSEGQ